MRTPRRILLVKPSSMGDVLHALPVVSEILRHWPEAELRWLIQPVWRPLVEGHPGVSGTILFRVKAPGPSGWMLALGWLRTCGTGNPIWPSTSRAAAQRPFRGSPAPGRWSDSPTRARGRDCSSEGKRGLIGMIMPCGAISPCSTCWGSRVRSVPSFSSRGNLPLGFSTDTPFVALHPYARGRGRALLRSMWAPSSGERHPQGSLSWAGVPPWKSFPPTPRTGRTAPISRGSSAILRAASFIVSTDSGPMHLAAALQPSRILSIHLWSDPLRVGPCFPESMVWKNGRVAPVAALDGSWRPEGRAPTEEEMEKLGRRAAVGSMKPEG